MNRRHWMVLTIALCGVVSGTQGTAAELALLPGDTTVSAAAGNQTAPAISQGDNTLLSVWTDRRANPYSLAEYETSGDIYGMRLDGDGNPIDTLPIAIATGPAAQENPRAAWNGTHWLVVFESYDLGGTGFYYQKSLEALRVAPDGSVVDGQPIKIYNDTPVGTTWAVSSDGAGWVVVNQGTSVTGDLVVSRISADGALLDPGPQSLVPATYYLRGGLHLAYAGGVFLLTYEEAMTGSSSTSALRFDSSLTPLDPAPYTLAPAPLRRMISNGHGFYAVWHEQLPDFSTAVKGSRIGTDGQRLDGDGVILSGTNPPLSASTTSVAWDGAAWKVTWGAADGTRLARVDGGGNVLDPGGIPVPGPRTGPSASTGNGSVQLVWADSAAGDFDISTVNIAASNAAGPNRVLSVGAPQQVRPDVATSGDGYMVVYRSRTGASARVLAQPLDAMGTPLTTGPIELDSGSYPDPPGSPNVAWSEVSGIYLVAWGSTNGVVAQRLLADGTKLDPAPFVVMSPAFGPADVAAVGDTFLVTGRVSPFPEYIFTIAARVNGADGAVLDATPLTLGGIWVARPPAVTAVGGKFLVAFHSNATHDESFATTYGAFVPVAGPNDPAFGIYSFSTAGGNFIFEIGLASSGDEALLVQSAELTSGVETDLLAFLIQPDGTQGPLINLTPWIGNQYRPRVAWDGDDFIVVFQDQKNRLAEWSLEQLDARSDLFGMRVSAAGEILDPQGFLISASPIAESDPTIAAADGRSLIAASLMVNDATFANYRIAYELLDASLNEWPVVVATATPAGGDVPLTVSFTATGSGDLDGVITDYFWDLGDGTTSIDPDPSHDYTVPGPYVATLTVTDDGGASSAQAILVKAVAANQPPVATASADKTSGKAPLSVVFSASGSYDPDGFIGNIEWHFSDGGTYYGATAYHTFTTVGSHTAQATVHDSRGGTDTATVTVTVTDLNQPPVAHASATPTGGDAPLTVTFSSAGSYDPDGAIQSYHWSFAGPFGPTSNEANPTYTYGAAGTFTATLTVTDDNNVSSSDSVVITVSPDPATTVHSAAVDLSASVRGSNVKVAGQVEVQDGVGAVVSGATVSATWTLPDGTTVAQSTPTNRKGVAKFSTSGGRGTYTLTVTNIYKYLFTFDPANSVLSATTTK